MAEASAGFHNAAVREARLLHQKKHRQERRCFLVEGPELVEAALRAGSKLERVFGLPDEVSANLRERLGAAGVPLLLVDQRTLDSLSQTRSPQGVVGVARFLHHDATELARLIPQGDTCVLVLPSLSDPGNAGTLVRSAEAFGASAVCFGPNAVDPYNDKVVRASMGSLFRLPLIWYRSWEELRGNIADAELSIVGSAASGADVRSVTLPSRAALVVGQERRGLGDIPQEDLALVVGVPHMGDTESLNAAVAGSILLYELSRRERLVKTPSARTTVT